MKGNELNNLKTIRGIYWAPLVLLPLFYLQAIDYLFNIFSGDVKDFLNTLFFTAAVLKFPPFFKKRRDTFIEEEIINEGINNKILTWLYILCISMICIWLFGYLFEPECLPVKVFVGISFIINSIFAILIIIGKFNTKLLLSDKNR